MHFTVRVCGWGGGGGVDSLGVSGEGGQCAVLCVRWVDGRSSLERISTSMGTIQYTELSEYSFPFADQCSRTPTLSH